MIPSFADCFFLAIIGWLFLAGPSGWKALLMDGDTGWHIRTGEFILDQGHVPQTDLFSYSRPNAPWFAWEWGSDVTFAVLFRVAGLKGIVLFAGVLIALISLLVFRYSLWRGANSLLALLATLLVAGASTMHYLARPHLFTLLLLPLSLWLIEKDLRKPGKQVWWLVPLAALWANLHGGFVVLLACLGLLIAAKAIESWIVAPCWPAVRRYSAMLAGCSLATLVNPYGINLHLHIWAYLRADWIRNLVQEFQAPTFRGEGQLQYEALLILGLAAVGFLLTRQRFMEAFWLVFLAHLSLTSIRHAPLYASVAGPIMATLGSRWWHRVAQRSGRSCLPRLLLELGEDLRPSFARNTVWMALPVLVLAVLNLPVAWPANFPREAFPIDMIERHQTLLSSGRVLTTDQWADYLIYRMYPRQRVFIDGRSDFYGEALSREYMKLLEGGHSALEVLTKRGFDVVLVPVTWPLAELLKNRTGWSVVEDDGHTILLQRRVGTAPTMGAPVAGILRLRYKSAG